MGSLKQSLVENISLQRCNCNILGLTDTVALFAKEAGFQFFRFNCSSGQVLSKTKSVTPHFFFYISDITNSSSFNSKICRKKSMLENFRANSNVLNDICRVKKRTIESRRGRENQYTEDLLKLIQSTFKL